MSGWWEKRTERWKTRKAFPGKSSFLECPSCNEMPFYPGSFLYSFSLSVSFFLSDSRFAFSLSLRLLPPFLYNPLHVSHFSCHHSYFTLLDVSVGIVCESKVLFKNVYVLGDISLVRKSLIRKQLWLSKEIKYILNHVTKRVMIDEKKITIKLLW